MKAKTTKPIVENEYDKLLKDAVEVIETSRLQVAKQVNNVVMSSYWKIGKLLEDRKIDSKHGDGIVKRLSIDLKSKYPNMGLSQRNLWDMKKFYLRYHQCNIKLRQAVAVLPWSHNLILMSYDLSPEYVEFYASHALKTEYHLSVKTAIRSNNFSDTLPTQQAEYQYLLPKNKLQELITHEMRKKE